MGYITEEPRNLELNSLPRPYLSNKTDIKLSFWKQMKDLDISYNNKIY